MMLRDLGYPEGSAAVEGAVRAAIAEGVGTADVGGKLGTRAVGEWISEKVRAS
jgi:3-isopropylmalate dehydrogenase